MTIVFERLNFVLDIGFVLYNVPVKMMDVFVKDKFTKTQLFQVFAFCTLLVNTWTIINMFTHIPSWLLYLDFWDFVGTISYTLSIALVDGVFLFVLVLGVGVAIPNKYLGDRFQVWGHGIALIVSLLVMSLNFYPKLYLNKKLILLIFMAASAAYYFLIVRFEKVRAGLDFVFDKLSILAYFYFGLNVLAAVIVVVRNVLA